MLRYIYIYMYISDEFIALYYYYVFEIFMQQESIVREIEEALRKEIIAASTLPERPRYQ